MTRTIGWIGSCVLLAACSQTPEPKLVDVTAEPDATGAQQALAPSAPDSPNAASISISDEIRRACGLSETDAFFDYDSSRVTPQADRVLAGLASCFTVGPLKGRGMKLVGHADPRGDSEYNLLLGGRRADHVGSALSKKGLEGDRISSSSRGEMDARGNDETTWAKDRRVEVMLAD